MAPRKTVPSVDLSPEKQLRKKLRNAREKIRKMRVIITAKEIAPIATVSTATHSPQAKVINFPPVIRKVLATLRDELNDVLAA